MPVAIFPSAWSIKPPGLPTLDFSHPLLLGADQTFTTCVPFYDSHSPAEIVRNIGLGPEGAASITRNSEGYAGDSVDTTGGWRVLTIAQAAAWLPQAAVTVAAIRRNKDTTLRAGAFFGLDLDGSELTSRIGAHVPYSDGTVYWDFGGATGVNRLTWGGYTKATAIERWVFTGGPAGMFIYFNGVQVASSGTAVSRAASTLSRFLLNAGQASSFEQESEEINLFLLLPVQWGQAQVSEWTARPYSIFLPQAPRVRIFQPSVVAPAAIPSLLMSPIIAA